MINCGGALDLTTLFGLADDPELDLMLFLLDSHRPLNLANIYDDDHVLVFELEEIQHPAREAFEGLDEDDPEVVTIWNHSTHLRRRNSSFHCFPSSLPGPTAQQLLPDFLLWHRRRPPLLRASAGLDTCLLDILMILFPVYPLFGVPETQHRQLASKPKTPLVSDA